MKQLYYFILITGLFSLMACSSSNKSQKQQNLANPIIPGYFADPSIVQHDGKFYLYATIDPWGGDVLSCWESEDFVNWTYNSLNWPTKAVCTTALSTNSNVWAPSVVKKDNSFYMYISVGSEIWCGKAAHPLGPWENILGSEPMIAFDTTRYYHVIDAEAFIDDDGRAYLYWGSGWDWTNGHCFAAELNDDMCSFKTEPVDITPTNYFEGPLMIKQNGKYFLTYSEGKTVDETYEVRYAVGDNPFGPFTEAPNSPILQTNEELEVYGPGHHSIFQFQNKHYILYHRHRLPFVTETAYRQICINELEFDVPNNQIKHIVPYSNPTFPLLSKKQLNQVQPDKLEASSEQDEFKRVIFTLDNSYATRWECNDVDTTPVITANFNNPTDISKLILRPEYAWKTYFIRVEVSLDGKNWETIFNPTDGVSGSPIEILIEKSISKLNLTYEKWNAEGKASLWELAFIKQ